MLKIGIVGCGKMSDQHAEQINRIAVCKIVGVCDREELMARQMAERFDVRRSFTSINSLIGETRPDVVHITTPPQSHYSIGMTCLEAGCHVYIEKPFTLTNEEAVELVETAKRKKLKLTVGHNAQFTHVANRMRRLINDGFLGGTPVHMESFYCYNLSNPSYAKALLGDSNHWVRDLPGKLLHNIISHGISKIAEFLPGNAPQVIANGFTSDLLESINERDIKDELRVLIKDNSSRTTATFIFSSQMNPTFHQFRLYGPKNSIIVDDDHQTLILLKGKSYKSYLNQFIPPLVFAKQYLGNSLHNIFSFLKKDFYNDSGMNYLIKRFYHSIQENSQEPIPYREILLTSKIMSAIFEQLNE